MKPFDPADVDETLTRVVVYGGKTHLLFPFINATEADLHYSSIGLVISGPAATVQDFQNLSLLLVKAAQGALWRIVFNTPWLIRASEEEGFSQRVERKSDTKVQ